MSFRAVYTDTQQWYINLVFFTSILINTASIFFSQNIWTEMYGYQETVPVLLLLDTLPRFYFYF